jgi:DNA polymerase III subunit epsilon
MGGVDGWAMAEQASFWEQSDLLGLLDGVSPAAESEPSAAAQSDTVPTGTVPLGTVPAERQPTQAVPSHQADSLTEEPTRPELRAEPSSAAPAFASPSAPVSTAVSPSMSAPVVALPALPGPGSRSLPSCPERLLVLDTETTALSREQGQCIEVGAVLFHVPSRAVLMQVSFLLPCPSNPAEAINGIPAPVSRLSQPWQAGLACFEAMVEAADAVVAHNVSFDRQWFGQGPLPALSKPWICSMEDMRWPAERKLRATPSVRDLALAYGIPVWAAHRALTDCIYLIQVFERCTDLELLLQAALEPRRLYRAQLGYAQRHLAKEAGFRWNEPLRGAWSRRLSEREAGALPFAVEPVDPLAAELPRTA